MRNINRRSILGAVAFGGIFAADSERAGASKSAIVTESPFVETLPTLRIHDNRIIGHVHIPDRGFHHWKTRLVDLGKRDFDETFTKIASQCDAVVFTSQSLLENDVYLPARSSIDMLTTELMTRLRYAFEDNRIVDHLVPIRGEQPRMFALGSAGAHRGSASLNLADLARQREIVFHSFGKPISRPMLIGMDLDQACESAIRDQMRGSNLLLLNALNGEDEIEPTDREWLKFVTFWPFDPNYGPWP